MTDSVKIKIKRLNDLAKIPTRGSDQAAGYDLYAASSYDIHIFPHDTVKIGTGIAAEIPEGYFGAIFARSGLASNKSLRPGNCVGVVDSDYRGDITVPLHNDSGERRTIEAGERIAQLVILPYLNVEFEEVDELSETDRGAGGFGSTGTK